MIVATESPEEYRRLATRLRWNRDVIVGLGLHPAGRAARNPGQLSRFFRLLPDAAWVSEVGLDFTRDSDRIERHSQIGLFEDILSHAMIRTKVLSVHSRGAAGEVTSRLKTAGVTAIMHWFSGSLAEIDEAVDAGLYFSVNSPMIRSRRAGSLLARVPLDRLLLETDGPYARGDAGAPLAPSSLHALVNQLASILLVDVQDLKACLDTNYRQLVDSTSVSDG
jgi:TatD DNase family protein